MPKPTPTVEFVIGDLVNKAEANAMEKSGKSAIQSFSFRRNKFTKNINPSILNGPQYKKLPKVMESAKHHNSGYCEDTFSIMAQKLDGYVKAQNKKAMIDQINKCLAIRVRQAKQAQLMSSSNNKTEEKNQVHLRVIETLDALKFFIQNIDTNNLQKIFYDLNEEAFKVVYARQKGGSTRKQKKRSHRGKTRKH